MGPVWQVIVPELVPRTNLRPAIALNSLGINISRAIGSALAGTVILSFGVAAVYAIDVASYVAIVVALVWWKRSAEPARIPEQLPGAMLAGLRYGFRSSAVRRVLLRAAIFFLPASCYWTILPLFARSELAAGPGGYGLLLGAAGGGAIIGAVAMPALRQRLPTFGRSLHHCDL